MTLSHSVTAPDLRHLQLQPSLKPVWTWSREKTDRAFLHLTALRSQTHRVMPCVCIGPVHIC